MGTGDMANECSLTYSRRVDSLNDLKTDMGRYSRVKLCGAVRGVVYFGAAVVKEEEEQEEE